MNYKRIMLCAVIGATMRSAQGMIGTPKDEMARNEYHSQSYEIVRAAFWHIDPALIKGKSSEEMRKIIDEVAEKKYKEQSSLKNLEKRYLEGEGFCDGVAHHSTGSYTNFLSGRWFYQKTQ
jgi:hypothetical protein